MTVAKTEYDMNSKQLIAGTGLAVLLAMSVTAHAGGLGGGLGGAAGGALGGNLSGFGGRGFSGTGSFASQGQLSGTSGSLNAKPVTDAANKANVKDKVDSAKNKVDSGKDNADTAAKDKLDSAKDKVAATATDKVGDVKDTAGNASAPTSTPAASASLNGTLSASSNQ